MNKAQKGFIGVFDSGFGGLTILKEVKEYLPEYDYLYLGDTDRAPYGDRPQTEIYQFTSLAVDFLFQQGCELIILACNTASSEALRKIQQEYIPENYPDKKVLGVLIPAAEEAVTKTINKRIGVLATTGTVESGAFVNEIQKLDTEVEVFQNPAPLLVPAVEKGEQNLLATKDLLEEYLAPLLEKNIDTLILGCTHYGVLENTIKEIVGEEVNVITEGNIVAEKLEDYLERHPEEKIKLSTNGTVEFFTTDSGENFQILGSQFFGEVIHPKEISLSQKD